MYQLLVRTPFYLSDLLVSTYVVYERLSVMRYTFQLPEFLVQNSLSVSTQVLQECWSEPLLLPRP